MNFTRFGDGSGSCNGTCHGQNHTGFPWL
jgi:hypothetical protein